MELKIGGKYRHYKGNEYRILAIARHSETDEKLVVYQALYDDGQVWVRPFTMWSETVSVGGRQVPRFQLIE